MEKEWIKHTMKFPCMPLTLKDRIRILFKGSVPTFQIDIETQSAGMVRFDNPVLKLK